MVDGPVGAAACASTYAACVPGMGCLRSVMEPDGTLLGMAAARTSVHTIKVGLRGMRPPVWRRLEVPSGIRLDALSTVIHAAFGWIGYHLWVFETARGEFGVPDPDLGLRDAAAVTLRAVAPRPGARLRYVYDFGDDWQHDIVVEAVGLADVDAHYPRCTAGRRAGPPEDCGGAWAFAELLEILADPHHEEHAERLEWLGLDSTVEFDPAAFDLAGINRDLLTAASP